MVVNGKFLGQKINPQKYFQLKTDYTPTGSEAVGTSYWNADRIRTITAGGVKDLAFTTDTPDLSDYISNTYETVSKNLRSYPHTSTDNGTDVTSIIYTTPTGTITKTFNRTGGVITSIVLSGDTPSGISLTKTLTYGTGILPSISYS